MSKELEKVAKIRRIDLRASYNAHLRSMAGTTKAEWKYLTRKQVDQVRRAGLDVLPLNPYDMKVLARPSKVKHTNPKVPKLIRVKVTFMDEDGIQTAEFTDSIEANHWIEAQEARIESGEKFEFISMEELH